jgi:hypothetical protein
MKELISNIIQVLLLAVSVSACVTAAPPIIRGVLADRRELWVAKHIKRERVDARTRALIYGDATQSLLLICAAAWQIWIIRQRLDAICDTLAGAIKS